MKKFMLCVLFFVSFCVSVAYIMEANANPETETSTKIVKEEKSEENKIVPEKCVVTNSEKNKYEVKEYCGNIAIFQCGSSSPVKTTSICVSELPKADREMLKKGIKASTEEELSTLLEDYCS